MLSAEEVHHVAKLARLELTEDEVEHFSGELSQVLDYIETIGELDLAEVEPTSHVLSLENALREDSPRPSLPREVALSNAPDADDRGFSVPSPGTVG